MERCGFVPPYLLREIARSDARRAAACCQDTLRVDEGFRATRETEGVAAGLAVHATAMSAGDAVPEPPAWTVHDAENGTRLPGRAVRSAGEPEVGDLAVDEAAAGIEQTLRLFAEAFSLASYDGEDAAVTLTVHYRRDYDNAFWDGRQLVFGDGDGEVFERFTKPVDVLGHEFGHAVTDHSAGLVYADQSGALNESVSDVFASCLLQWLAGQEVEAASWLIGEGLFRPGIEARALRDMAAPGTAYDDPVLGRDPQVGHMDDFVVTEEDNGGVHLNSGIPNKAFHLAALALGGRVWERAGLAWFHALTAGQVGPDADFATFAEATVASARTVLDEAAAEAVADAWAAVGVTAGAGSEGTGTEPGEEAALHGRVCVRRSGGFAGRTTTLELDLEALPDEQRAAEVAALIPTVRSVQVRPAPPVPDGFLYTFEVPGGRPVQVPEQQMTDELRRLAEIVRELGHEA